MHCIVSNNLGIQSTISATAVHHGIFIAVFFSTLFLHVLIPVYVKVIGCIFGKTTQKGPQENTTFLKRVGYFWKKLAFALRHSCNKYRMSDYFKTQQLILREQ